MLDVTINKAEEKMVRNGDAQGAFESMFTRFNRLVQDSGVIKEVKKFGVYEKPSVARSRKRHIKLIKSRQQGKEKDNAVHQKRGKKTFRPNTGRSDS